MKPTFVPCQKADVLQAYCCLRQVAAAFAFAQVRQPEVQAYLKANRQYYLVPPFSGSDYLQGDGRKAESDQVWEAIDRQKTWHGLYRKHVARKNKYRSETYRINTLTLHLAQCGFRQIESFLASEKESFGEDEERMRAFLETPGALDDMFALCGTLHAGCAALAADVGQAIFQKADKIVSFRQSSGRRRFRFEEVLAFAQRFDFNRYVRKARHARRERQDRRARAVPVYRRCTRADVLQAYSCLRQVDYSLHYWSDYPEVRAFVRRRLAYYAVPVFADRDCLAGDGLQAEGEQAMDANAHLSCWQRTFVFAVAALNRLRRKTFLINASTLWLAQCGFRQINAFLESASDDADDWLDVAALLREAEQALRRDVGERHFEKAREIERVNQPKARRCYTFDEVLANA